MSYTTQSSAQYAGVIAGALLTATAPSIAHSQKRTPDNEIFEITNFELGPPTFITTVARHSTLSSDFTTVPDVLQFNVLAEAWDKEIGALSSTSEIVMCPSYQQIIGMGERALPFIFRQLEKERKQPNNWFWALRAITRADPVFPEDRGNRPKMASAWLRWGRARYVW